ncbi:MAG: NfeD family protein [Thermoplasmata archaeon]
MVETGTLIAALIVVAGVVLLAVELVHPGALLLIPAAVLLTGGLLYLFLPNDLLQSPVGVIIIAVAAIAATLIEIPYYRHLSPGHPPMVSIPTTLIGREGLVVAAVVPNSLRGKVRIDSEVWSAQSTIPIPAGTIVRVVGGEGVSISVTPLAPSPTTSP